MLIPNHLKILVFFLDFCRWFFNTRHNGMCCSASWWQQWHGLLVHFTSVTEVLWWRKDTFVVRLCERSVQSILSWKDNLSILGGGFKYFLFSPLPGEIILFDEYFSDGLKPPTRYVSSFSGSIPVDSTICIIWVGFPHDRGGNICIKHPHYKGRVGCHFDV